MNYNKAWELVNSVWKNYDKDGNGELDWTECILLLRDIAAVTNDQSLITDSDKIISCLDTDCSGTISKNEMIKLILGKIWSILIYLK